jgi:tetratricopeptide (TPR) repeat protein
MILALILAAATASNGSYVAYAASVSAHHKRADLLLKKHDLAGATAEMRSLIETPPPADPRATELLLDGYGRLGELLLQGGKPVEAVTALREGVGRAAGPTAFLARLYVIMGDALGKLGRDDDALDAYQKAIDVNTELLKLLKTPDAGETK